jgi:hypothetical protein
MWGIIGHVTVEAGNTVGTDGAPPQDDIYNRLSKRYINTLFLRFLSLRDEWVRVKRTGRRTPINEKTTFFCNHPPKRYNNTLFLRFLSLRDEWVGEKRTGRRTQINEKTTFITVFPKDVTIPCF